VKVPGPEGMRNYRVVLRGNRDEASAQQCMQAEQRFARALEAELGDAALVLPVYQQYQRLFRQYGHLPDLAALTDAEREVMQAWQGAESAALIAALGPHRHMDDPQFDILPG
jgi:hypothetical protein